ncbi:MAG: 1-deoxy-D-xylulose-5-phosphate synthase [Nitrospirae bacterium CG18_big_fil_WC_8_21_14_2_50_70_55]|nr:1-deoxy-D-xylulose-5-phosphate synthase [Deltaproteobacteria bacterium]OIP65624.1 MAG: 1-deoxy-D-xylulose-5-phosphate synthase [Nitrospirae bacterium CG2_30_70_394]PIQ07316.1 MAG: 1-deoxy-D-xylulose-5-phosphate synthase [Nitrospirae bacterium CG18_big_fil_WC_8_21_14_2_50_70_55]PIU80252.1 MAG: 1-deoxy-D-xylulose-5-phosphate synthase [Nitrospirae bacterium CG06_land_8_20_14_3_00_70_43]PIW82708.1 MAG: 1-deoxy-D-xylulose-5-phosphate synthase [Nitrospirae bacterium CG_4_8_14_3_um_filter_70_85]PI
MSLLDQINSPADLKPLSFAELANLAAEIRERLIEVCAVNGGHVGASLGVVELTLALHYCFDSPTDRIVWDVSHQAYAHKLLTGRRDAFATLRQAGGLSGFTCRTESPHDPFGAGHAGTSVSAALGFAAARDIKGEHHKTIAVIGDGALTAGLAFEALNHGGGLAKELIVVLNDNEFSIAPNVGALSAYLSRHLAGDTYQALRAFVERLLNRLPGVGEPMLRAARSVEDSLKQAILPGMLFEELGFAYIGPIKGHDIKALIEAFGRAAKLHRPVLVHCATQKGKGYPFAEKDPAKWHGLGPYDVATGKPRTGTGAATPPPTYMRVFGDTLIELAERDPRIVAITAAMESGTGLTEFARRFPDRFFDVGIAEQHAATFAAALAADGLRPVAAIYSTFLQRAFDQLIHDVALQRLGVTFAIDRAGLVGEDGPTHHGVFDLAYLRPIPNFVVMAPKDEQELRHMLATCLTLDTPAAVRYPRGAGLGVPLDGAPELLEVGKGEWLRTGNDVTLLALGTMVAPALAAAGLLARDGIDAQVVNLRFAKPLDHEIILAAAATTGRLVTLEEGQLAGGVGSAVAELLADTQHTGVALLRLGLPDQFTSHGARAQLLAAAGLDADSIAHRIATFVRAGTTWAVERR